jgi:hypothetical protein
MRIKDRKRKMGRKMGMHPIDDRKDLMFHVSFQPSVCEIGSFR